MEFDQNVNLEDLCTKLENSVKQGKEEKAIEFFLQILEKKVYLQIDLEEKPKKIQPKIELNESKNEKNPIFEGYFF